MAEADLHVHTSFSDGKLTPYQVIEAACSRGLTAVGITDHDTMKGIPQALWAGRKLNMEVVPGVELSTYFIGKEIHILGYYCQAENPLLKKTLSIIRMDRYSRIIKMLALLKKNSVDLDFKDVLEVADGGDSLGRPHLAVALCQKGFCRTPGEAFQRFLSKGKPAFVKRLKISSPVAIQLIRRSGGIAVMAHPKLYRKDSVIPLLARYGLAGIEVFHPDHRRVDCRRYNLFAKKLQLIVTGGSDFHGHNATSNAAPGDVAVSYYCLEALKKAAGVWRQEYNRRGVL